jgi:AraC-like DNA-binding protein
MAHPLAFRGFLRELGAPVDRAFQVAGLPVLCETADAIVPMPFVQRMFAEMVQRETPDLGWHVGHWCRERSLHRELLTHIAASPTLDSALLEFTKLVRLENSKIQLGIAQRSGDVLFWVENPLPELPGYDVGQSYSLKCMIEVLRTFIGPGWQPKEIGIQPAAVPRAVEQMYPGTRIVSGCKKYYVAIDRTHLTQGPHESMRANGSSQATTPLTLDALSFAETLQSLLKTYLADGCPSVEFAAEMADVSVRTLQRRLDKSGTSYSEVVGRVRFDSASTMLTQTDASVAEIAYDVGYSDPSHFARAFRSMAGVGPREYRQQAQRLSAE